MSLEAKEMWFFRIAGTKQMSNGEVLKKIGNIMEIYIHNQKETDEILAQKI